MNRLLRRILPTTAVATLSRARRSADVATARATTGVLALLPLRVRSHIKERFEPTGRLDYARGDIRLFVDSEVECNMRLFSCAKEPETVAWIETFVLPGDVVYDIGANVGAYSFVVDRHSGGHCRVFAFEPSFTTFTQLSRNIFLNGCQARVTPLLVALSDRTALVRLHYSSLASGAAMHTLLLGDGARGNGSDDDPSLILAVPSYRLDDFVATFSLPAPNHIKLDVDGVEEAILRGAARTLANVALRTVLAEAGAPDEADCLVRVLAAHGFALRSRHPHGTGTAVPTNLVFVRETDRA